MKKHLIAILIFFGVSLVLFKTLFNPGFPQSHDGEMHLGRLANLYLAVRDHHLPPRWAGSLNYQYGYPIFNFNYYLTELLAVPLFSLGLSVEWSLKLVLMVCLLASPIIWYLFLQPLFGFKPALIAGLVALTAVYPWENFYVRGSTGEVLVWPLLALSFLLLQRLINRPGRLSFLLATGVLTAFMLAHNISVMFGLPLLIGFCLVSLLGKKPILWRLVAFSFILALGLSLFFWLPLVIEQQYTIIKAVHPAKRFLDHFPSLYQLFFSKWGYGFSFSGDADTMGFNLGPAMWLGLLLAFLGRKKTKLVWFFLLAFLGFMFLSLPISKLVWLNLPFLYVAQFPWRLLLFMSVSAVFLVAFAAKAWPRLSWLVVAVSLVYALVNIRSQGFIHAPDMSYFQYPFTTTTENEHKPKWFNTDKAINLAQTTDRVFNAQKSEVQLWKTQEHVYTVTVAKDQPVFEKTAYFPGWEVFVDGKATQIIYEHPDYPGLLGYELSAGTHQVISKFTNNTPARQLGNALSLVSLGLLAIILIFFPGKMIDYAG